MNKDSIQLEVSRSVEQAMQGNWIPFAIIIGCLSVIIWLVIFILKMKEAQLNKRHDSTDELLKQTTKTQNNMELLLERVVAKQDQHDIEIRDLKRVK